MGNRTPAATLHGWSEYRAAVPPPSLDEINEHLQSRGLDCVSPRTYDHYGRLVRHGYDHYIPINELDMRVKLGRHDHN